VAIHALDLAPFWTRLVMGFAAGALTWIIAADIGCELVGRWIRFNHPAARLAVGAATGYALLGSAVGLLAIARAVHPVSLSALLAIALVLRAPKLLQRLRSLPAACTRALNAFRSADLTIRLALLVKVCAECTGLVIAALPPVWWDPIAYHLPIAAATLSGGGFAFDPQMVQSGFPLLGEAAALPAYALAGSAGAAMVTVGAGMCVALLVWAIADMLSAGSGPVAGMLVVTSGLWLWLAPSFYVDVPFAMFVIAGILVALETHDRSPFLVAALAGALAGAAAATKYSGLALALIIFVLAVWAAGPHRRQGFLGFLAGFAVIAAGWYLRTFVLTADPIYPFLSHALAAVSQVRDFAARYVEMTTHWCGGGSSLADLVTLPYRLVADPRQFCGDPGLALRIGIVFAIIAVIVIVRARVVAAVCAVMTLFWFATSQQWRFALPALFLYAAIIAAGVSTAGERLRQIGTVVLSLLGAYVVLTNWLPELRSQASSTIVPAYAYIAGRQSAEQYLDTRLETFAAARWFAEHNIPGDQIVALDDVRDYYFPRGTAWANPYYQQVIALDWHADFQARYREFAIRGYKYIVVNSNDAYLHRTPTGVDWNVFARDRQRFTQLFSANGVTIYRLQEGR
jgi:hypothetical protein